MGVARFHFTIAKVERVEKNPDGTYTYTVLFYDRYFGGTSRYSFTLRNYYELREGDVVVVPGYFDEEITIFPKRP